MTHDEKKWWKIWSGTDLPFQNWHKEFDEFWLMRDLAKFSPEHLKVSKLGPW